MMDSRLKILVAASLALLIAFGLTFSSAIAADRLRIGLSSFTPINAAVWIAEDKGLFKKYGIDPEVIVVGGASAGGVSSLLAGDIQFLTGGGGAVINAALSGADVVMVASIVNKGVQRVMARADLKRPEDLKGKRIGVTRLGASSHMVLLLMLRAWKMNPTDVQAIQVGSSPAMMAARVLCDSPDSAKAARTAARSPRAGSAVSDHASVLPTRSTIRRHCALAAHAHSGS